MPLNGLLQQKKRGGWGGPPPRVKTKETDTKQKKRGGWGGPPPTVIKRLNYRIRTRKKGFLSSAVGPLILSENVNSLPNTSDDIIFQFHCHLGVATPEIRASLTRRGGCNGTGTRRAVRGGGGVELADLLLLIPSIIPASGAQ